MAACGELLRDLDHAYPDLSQISLGVVARDDRPALRPRSPHPYATGFVLTDGGRTWTLGPDETWTLPSHPAGEYTATVATSTPYATLSSYPIIYRTAQSSHA